MALLEDPVFGCGRSLSALSRVNGGGRGGGHYSQLRALLEVMWNRLVDLCRVLGIRALKMKYHQRGQGYGIQG